MSGSIIVGYDGSEGSALALRWAAQAAQQRGRTLEVITTWTMPSADLGIGASGTLQGELLDDLRAEAKAANDEGLRIAAELGANATGEVLVGRTASALVHHSEGAEMVAVGSHGSGGLTGYLLGSVSRQVATHAQCPTVVVRSVPEGGQDMVVGVDGSPHSLKALEWAFEQASFSGMSLRVLHSWEIPPTWSMVEVPSYEPEVLIRDYGNAELRETSEAMAGFRENFPDVKVRQEVMKGSPVKALVKASEGAAMLVVGSRGLGGFRGLLLGSVSHAVVHKADCPVAVVP
ncbi:MAG: universal stress protein [Actinobacteria bacterium]|jgi:nucleotide-binding universal stress UspA family protein|nr:universal stress protein [Micrococcales bacterium]MCB0904527.1 universal stress protein [Actinomycetota bacterium]MCO5299361.1 universal stress protein [Candidatus Nanopelagicales bacterium]MCB9427967.1 universal stress protein [Actinomycetota bacterium]HPE12569.1 universal stress protein [Actinomycetota bacterium]